MKSETFVSYIRLLGHPKGCSSLCVFLLLAL